MLSSFKGKPVENQRSGATVADTTPITRDAPTTRDNPTQDTPETISAIGSGMTIVGKIVCDGVLQIFGRIEGELRATNVLIANHANVQGDIIADELTVEGDLKGTIHATRVRIRATGSVQGDIFHQSLAIEENAQFEGMSRRHENPTAAKTSATATGAPATDASEPSRVSSIDSYRRTDSGLDNAAERVTAG